MLLVRVFSALAKPALAGSIAAGTIAGGYLAWDATRPDGLTPFQSIQQADARLIVSEFGENEDTIVAIDPDDTSDRTTLATIDHAPGWGIFATLSPGGDAIAYTALPPDTAKPSPDTPAIAGVIEADGDVIGETPMTFVSLPRALRVIVAGREHVESIQHRPLPSLRLAEGVHACIVRDRK